MRFFLFRLNLHTSDELFRKHTHIEPNLFWWIVYTITFEWWIFISLKRRCQENRIKITLLLFSWNGNVESNWQIKFIYEKRWKFCTFINESQFHSNDCTQQQTLSLHQKILTEIIAHCIRLWRTHNHFRNNHKKIVFDFYFILPQLNGWSLVFLPFGL